MNKEIPDGQPQHKSCGSFMEKKERSTGMVYWKCNKCTTLTDNLDKIRFVQT